MTETAFKLKSNHCDQPHEPSICVILVAAGRGVRAGGDRPKQYQLVAGRMLLSWTLKHLQQALPKARILPVINPDHAALFEEAANGIETQAPVAGGATRQESVRAGLDHLSDDPPDLVLIHDAARPFVLDAVVARLLSAFEDPSLAGALPGLRVVDTLKKTGTDCHVSATIDRTDMWRVQTPQAARFDLLLAAHQKVDQDMTDDIALLEAAGYPSKVIEGDEALFKVTEPQDFARAEAHIMNALPDIRVGSGFDVHRFEAGNAVILGGVSIPHTAKLKGHSDADVLMHAITDALLAAISDGDIGQHFPPSDPQWKGAASDIFLRFAAQRIRDRGGMIAHVSATVIAEAPKVGPHRSAITARLAEIMDIPPDRVAVQATTSEKLGFTGRGEGIAVDAVATVRLPISMSSEVTPHG